MVFSQKCLYLELFKNYLKNHDDKEIIRYTTPRFRKIS
jgi:hypothetical protein